MSTLQKVMQQRLQGTSELTNEEADGGVGFPATRIFAKWLVDGSAPGAEPTAFNSAGRILPSITVIMPNAGEVRHPSVNVPGRYKWDVFPSVYLFHWPSEHGKEMLDRAKIVVEESLCDPTWEPVITGDQRPMLQPNTETHLDNTEQFPGNYVIVLTYRVTGMRQVWL